MLFKTRKFTLLAKDVLSFRISGRKSRLFEKEAIEKLEVSFNDELRHKTKEEKERRQEIFAFFAPEAEQAYLCPIEAFDINPGMPDQEFSSLIDLNGEDDDEPCSGYSYRKKDGALYFLFGEAAK